MMRATTKFLLNAMYLVIHARAGAEKAVHPHVQPDGSAQYQSTVVAGVTERSPKVTESERFFDLKATFLSMVGIGRQHCITQRLSKTPFSPLHALNFGSNSLRIGMIY